LNLTDDISLLKGVGEQRAKRYKKLGVDTIGSLIHFFPRTYIDLTSHVFIADAVLNEVNVIKATVVKKKGGQVLRNGLSIFKVFADDTIQAFTITIFNSKYQYDALVEGQEYIFYGKVTGGLLAREMTSPNFIKADENALMRPVYNLTEGLTNKMVQTNVEQALTLWGDCLEDDLSPKIKQEYQLCQLRYALENIHFPKDMNALKIAQKRLVFEELLTFQLGLILLRQKNRTTTSVVLKDTDISDFYSVLPFTLTNGQQNSINDGLADMRANIPMNRLCQGDVGSGKTMVASALCYACFKNGYQSAIMAPTQILADQHYSTIKDLLEPLGVTCCLLTGSQKVAQRREILKGIANGDFMVVIGTHALVQESVEFTKLGLVVTDEQHRFGVEQRATLEKKGDNPHLLVMSATPIPRTLALIIYGDLDISVIKELPAGRKPIETFAVSSNKRERALSFVKKQIDEGRQAYIVCPLIDEGNSDLVSVNQYISQLQKTPLAKYSMQAINGKLKSTQKETIMMDFKENKVQILVSTTVIEVGVDVPNANIMLIENAERFGLSQLHQLRGRVGRGEHQSYCVLISDNDSITNQKRLKIMKETNDGFAISEEDLKLRGPGDFFGLKQHGLPALKIASLVDDINTLKQTQKLAKKILKADYDLSTPENMGLRNQVQQLFHQNNQTTMN